MEQESNSRKQFVSVVLPWVIAIGALVLYLVTFNHWVSIYNIETVSKIAGWNWIPDMHAPLTFLVMYPFRWLPMSIMPLALNLFTVICAVLTLVLLARSVALLPHDKTDDQRQRIRSRGALLSIPSAWLPPVLAVIVCGLQLTFWEHATNATGEMLDLLLFAYIIRSLLEYRIDKRQAWLTRSAVLYGLGMTNNWALIGYFPIFIMALIWLMGWKFFNLGFLGRMALLGLAGLSLYFLLPLLQMFSKTMPLSFWVGLKGNLGGQAHVLMDLIRSQRQTIFLLCLISLLPVFVLSIRWPSYFGDPSPLGVALAKVTFHFAHALFLIACVWVAFDPKFSPRVMLPPVPLLTFYYLGALGIGYFAGYFLLVFSQRPVRADQNRLPPWMKYVNAAATGLVWLVFVVAAAGLFYKNFPLIHNANDSTVVRYAKSLTERLPAGAAILSDDALHLRLAEAALTRAGRAKDYIAIDSQAFKWPQYHAYLHQRYGANWTETVDPKREKFYEDSEMVNLLLKTASERPIHYLHTSFGYYFEFFQPIQRGMTYELKQYEPGQIFPSALTETEIAENEAFWKKAEDEAFPSLLKATAPTETGTNYGFQQFFHDALNIPAQPNLTAYIVASLYSQPLNSWGVSLQKADRLEAANKYFTVSRELSPGYLTAVINQGFNKSLRTGEKAEDISSRVEDDQLPLLSRSGPLDEPEICLRQSRIFAEGGLTRQAIIELNRVIALAPDNFTARLRLAQLYAQVGLAEQALEITSDVRDHPKRFPLNSTNRTDLLTIESVVLFNQNKADEAQNVIQRSLRENPDNAYLLNAMMRVSIAYGSYSNAFIAADNLLRIFPDDAGTLINKGYVQMRLNQLDAAIATFTHALAAQTNNQLALLNRAICYLRADRLDEALRDYQDLEKVVPGQYQVAYGLAEIAWRRKETNAAIEHYAIYLSKVNTNTTEAQFVVARLKELKGEKP